MNHRGICSFFAIFLTLETAGGAAAQSSGTEQRIQERIVLEVRHELLMIPQVTIFDNLAYRVDGSTVTLMGEVRSEEGVIKDEAASAVKHIEGVEKINNQIEILPPSPLDNQIRFRVARAIFREPMLFQYSIQSVPPIHIIVKGSRVDLEGVVRTENDKNIAGLRANGVPGVFSVQNNLQVEKK